MRTIKKAISKIKAMRPPNPPPIPPAIVPVLNRFKATAVLFALGNVLGAIKLVCTTRYVDTVSGGATWDVDWSSLNQQSDP